MKSIYKLGFTATAGLTILFSSTIPAGAESLSDKEVRQQGEVDKIQKELQALQADITKLNDSISANQTKIRDNEKKIEEKEGKIAELEASIEKRIEVLKERAVAIQQQDRTNIFVDVILNSKGIADLLQNITSLNTLFQSDTEIMEKLHAEQTEVEAEKAALNDAQTELENAQKDLRKQEADREDSLANLQSKLNTAMNDLSATKAKLEAAALFIADNSDTEEISIAASSNNNTTANTNNPAQGESNNSSNNNTTTPPVTGSGDIVSIGLSYLGVPYVFGGKTPSGFDCSGFIYYVLNQAGHGVGYQTAAGYYGSTSRVSSPAPGDLVFFSNTYMPGVSHVGIYIGGNQFVHAGGNQVQVTSLSNSYWSAHFTGYGRL